MNGGRKAMIESIPIQYISLAILTVNLLQFIAVIVIYFKGKKK